MVVPEIAYTRTTLPNGLTLVVHEDHKAPVVAVSVWYHVGSGDEPKGKSGFAHLFEHLMFSGSENHKGSFFAPFELAGATGMNGTTGFDITNYFETVPTTALDMALWMESDRMGHLLGAIGQKELDTQRAVVQNEKRQGENAPYGRVYQNILSNIYPANHPYQHDIIGSMQDLNGASLADVKQWFHDRYGAANAVIVLAGDITPAQAKEKVVKYFGDIPAGPPVPRQQPWITPLAKSTRGVQHDHVSQTRIYRTWVVPQLGTDDLISLYLAATVLGGGRTSRLYQRLVYQDKLADNVSAGVSPLGLTGQFLIIANVRKGVDSGKVESVIADELNKFLIEGPTQDELDRAKVDYRASLVRGLEKVGDKAQMLASRQLYLGDPGAYKKDQQRVDAATVGSVKASADRWLTKGDYLLTVLPGSNDFDPQAEDAKVVPLPDAQGRPEPKLPAAQQYVVSESEVDRAKGVPQVTHFPELRFPKLERGKLKNGIEVVLAQHHTVPVTQISLQFDGGYAADQGRKLGTASFAASLMGESTKSLDALEVAKRMQRLGAIMGVSCGLDTCSAFLDTLNDQLKPSLALFADIVRNPAFKADDIERVRAQRLAHIAQEKADPGSLAGRMLPPLLYGQDHAYSIPFTGTGSEASIKSLTADDLEAFRRDWLRPDNVKILVAGDTTLKEITPQLDAVFGDWRAPSAPLPKKNIEKVADQAKPRVFLIDRPKAPQSLILAGLLAPSSKAINVMDIDIANGAFGGTFTSRLNMNLREEKRWSYGAHSGLVDAVGQRPFQMYASVQADKTIESALEMEKEAVAIGGAKPLTAQEVDKVRSFKLRCLPGSFETTGSVIGAVYSIVEYGRPDDYVQTLEQRIEAVSVSSAQVAIDEIVKPRALTWVIVGDLNKIEQPVRELGLGKVHVLDAEGRLVR
ncbi:M16 family metallopeptidase [Paraburkholderia mimosarum]|uniref:M16 family metallopeptidase n=1 Tax=Paraburkholderia mimosarum TaxID=312026 RepID=UPI0012DDB6D2|nr:pitrilysin family protein [Paraburkholderia mimosarum]